MNFQLVNGSLINWFLMKLTIFMYENGKHLKSCQCISIKNLCRTYHIWKATWKYLLNIKIDLPFYTTISIKGVYPLQPTHKRMRFVKLLWQTKNGNNQVSFMEYSLCRMPCSSKKLWRLCCDMGKNLQNILWSEKKQKDKLKEYTRN